MDSQSLELLNRMLWGLGPAQPCGRNGLSEQATEKQLLWKLKNAFLGGGGVF